MPIQVLMPALSPTMEKGNLAKWLKKEGDAVKSGDVIAEIETDKATMEVEAVDEGTLGKILIPEGTADVAVNTPIAVILAEGESGDGTLDVKPAPAAKKADGAAPPLRPNLTRPNLTRPSLRRPNLTPPSPRPRRRARRSSPIPICPRAPRW